MAAFRLRVCLAVLLAAAAWAAAIPSSADTAGDLRAAKARVAAIQADLDRMAARYAAAQSRLALTQERYERARVAYDRTRDSLDRIRGRLAARVREAYESGTGSTVELLLTSSSFAEFSDRVEFLGSVARSESDLLGQATVAAEQLRRDQKALTELSSSQRAQLADLAAQRSAIASSLDQAQAAQDELQRKLSAEQAAAADAGVAYGKSPLQACPVGHPRAFSDDFGDPRPGGRTHQGIDMLAPLGTPVYAAQAGRFEQDYNDLGGISALVYATNGDFTYYAHLSSYAGVANGSTVGPGTVIGHVGNTGDAAGGPYHLHFEYHPGGGSAVDPYRYLVVMCG